MKSLRRKLLRRRSENKGVVFQDRKIREGLKIYNFWIWQERTISCRFLFSVFRGNIIGFFERGGGGSFILFCIFKSSF